MMPGATLVWAALAVIAGTGLFLMKSEVQSEERHLRRVQKDIVKAEQAIHVLRADWSYLNDPQRIRGEAERYLGLHPMRASQVTTISNIPLRGDTAVPPGPTTPVALPSTVKPAAKQSAPEGAGPRHLPAPSPTQQGPAHQGPSGHSAIVQQGSAATDPEVASTRMRP